MQVLDQRQMSSYTSGVRAAKAAGGSSSSSSSFLPAVFSQAPALQLRRSLTSLPWRPASFYQTAASSRLSDLEGIKVPPVLGGSGRTALYTRHTPGDWSSSNAANFAASERARSSAERIRFDSLRLCREVEDRTRRAQEESGKSLGDRVADISFWKTELQRETDCMLDEVASLAEAKRLAEVALAETENPLQVAQECLYSRERRQAVDLVHDLPEKMLLLEVDVIKRSQDRLRKIIEKANAQLSRNRAAQHELEKDTGDKFSAQHLDEKCHGLKNCSGGIAFHNGVENVDATVSVPETWAKFSSDNIQRSQSERSSSAQLRAEIAKLIASSTSDMWQQYNAVNSALSQRAQESADARNKLQAHLSQVLQEIFDMEKNIEFLKKAIKDKEAPYQVAHTRLDTRTRRPNVELCRDPAQLRLVAEVQEIRDTVEQLQAKLREAEASLQLLLKTKATLEQDLSVKNNSLFIDREKCLGLRKTFTMSPSSSAL